MPGFGSVDTNAPSVLVEDDLELPAQFSIKQRGQLYRFTLSGKSGWENRLDLTRRLTAAFFLTLRREFRRNYPTLDANDIDRIRLLFGADF